MKAAPCHDSDVSSDDRESERMTDASADDLDSLLEELDEEERRVSARRRKLHDRMAIFPDETGERARQEREVSQQRRELHQRIDELREQRSRLRGAPPD
jgi:chromosome segregation ATPase